MQCVEPQNQSRVSSPELWNMSGRNHKSDNAVLGHVDEDTYAATLPDHKIQQLFGFACGLEATGHLYEACFDISGYSSPQNLKQADSKQSLG